MMNGSQCGFCTPGIVMSLYALLRNNLEPSELEVEEAFDGNLCRCTGYRPILDAAQTFSTRKGCGKAGGNIQSRVVASIKTGVGLNGSVGILIRTRFGRVVVSLAKGTASASACQPRVNANGVEGMATS